MKGNPIRVVSLILAVLAWFCPLDAVALFRGEEWNPREFDIARLYFINRTSYELPYHFRDRFAGATNALVAVGGSLSSDDLYLMQNLKAQQGFGSAYVIRAEYLRDRDFDGHFQRFSMGLTRRISDQWAVELVGQPMPNKEEADVGAAILYASDRWDGRIQVLRPLFVFEDKNPDNARLEQEPWNVQATLAYRIGRSWELFWYGDFDFESELVNPAQSFEFQFRKFQVGGGATWHVGEQSHVQAMVDAEQSRQSRRGLQVGDPLAFELERDYLSVQLEWIRSLPQNTHVRVGSRYVYFDEDMQHPFAPLDSMRLDRQDRIVYVGRTWAMRERIHLHSMALIDLLDERRVSELPEEARDDRTVLARATASVQFLGDHYIVEGGAGLTVSGPRFGGGFIRVFMDF